MDMIGITNAGDPALNKTWLDNLHAVKFAIVISKGADAAFEKDLLDHKDKIIYHATCTGLGGTAIEPGAPTVVEKFEHLKRIINRGFPVSQIVVRIDPLLPYDIAEAVNAALAIDYIAKLKNILMMTEHLGIQRVRYSHLDEFEFTKDAFNKIAVGLHPNRRNYVSDYLLDLRQLNPNLHYESCTEPCSPPGDKFGCISDIDASILGMNRSVELKYPPMNNFSTPCRCPLNKLELLLHNGKFDCKFGCIYCYWRQDEHKRPL